MTQAALHLTIAALTCLLAGGAPPHIFIVGLALALLPDLDTPKSLIGSLLHPISDEVERRLGHRTATHSAPATIAVAAVAYLLAPAWWGLLTACYASHIALDLFIGHQGVRLLWPAGDWLTITSWRDDGPAPRRLLAALLPLTLLVGAWPALGPGIASPLGAAAALANPIATPTLTRTPAPSINLSFELPPGVGLSALTIRVGDTLQEGQEIARWGGAAPTPTATAASPSPAEVLPAPPADASGLVAARTDLTAAQAAQAAERATLRLRHDQEAAAARRTLETARRALGELQPQHERAQDERQHAVDAALAALSTAQSAVALAIADPNDPQALLRAQEKLAGAQADLQQAIDAQVRMRAEQGVERQQLQAALDQAQSDLSNLPARQESERIALEARLNADLARAQGHADAAQAGLAADEARASDARDRAVATAAAQARAEAAATAAAAPTPWPSQVRARAAGRVARIGAEERDGRLVVTVELAPL
jgi:membrane-bound metal-dependent hydrolase YbcI (DUF457 family)